MLNQIDAYAFEIYNEEAYKLAVALTPALSEIKYEALQGHYYVMTGNLAGCTVPVSGLVENRIDASVALISVRKLTRK